MQEPVGIPACYPTTITRSGQSVFMSVFRTKIADQCHLITITWCKNLLLNGLSVSISGPEGETTQQYNCKVEFKPWYFGRKQGSKHFIVDGNKAVNVFWDLKAAKFNGETEPSSEYYVAVVYNEEVILLVGDLKKDAYRKTGCRPALIDPILVSRKEHVFGKRKFCTRIKFDEKSKFHEISIEYKNKDEPEMEIRIDEHLVLHVKHLQWKFRGNESLHVDKASVEVYWDVHDWLFCPGLRHALFIFKPIPPLLTQKGSCGSLERVNPGNMYIDMKGSIIVIVTKWGFQSSCYTWASMEW
ncbi:uncharacterized protein LOC105786760 isoform X1 [Gossypium raimondii]|uniref:DUF868 domain-containing protein n=2 Tax=Gossypium raimondii TaxID=29730 RepID=A0A0D2PV55_GOSRA|nr:uncharacterized protein LOC105786760 isoform X1 [Gossypium raimondii]KJB08091.1 hypothetical protein B456_001G064200 [Gossypium raimondii]